MLSFVLLAVYAGTTLADMTPTAPGPGDVFAAGSDCMINWTADTSGHWTNVTIYLMSGSNDNMTQVTTVASGLDGTDASLSPYKWTCPEVDPYSAIYFYQLTNADNSQDSAWTTRFSITSSSGDSQPPEHTTQPAGDAIPWGEGRLASDDTVSAQEAGFDDSSPSDADQGDDNGSDGPLSTSRTHKDTANAPSGTPDSSLYWTANSLHARPTPTTLPASSGAVAEDVVPTVSLPTKKAHASHSGSPSSSGPASSETSCSGMGPGVSQVGGMKLASAATSSRGVFWLNIVPLYPVFFAMLL